jgi:hypothetical protein
MAGRSNIDLPYAWFNAATIVVLLAMAWAMQRYTRPRPVTRSGKDLHD